MKFCDSTCAGESFQHTGPFNIGHTTLYYDITKTTSMANFSIMGLVEVSTPGGSNSMWFILSFCLFFKNNKQRFKTKLK